MLKSRPILSFLLLAYGFTWTMMLPLLLAKRGFIAPLLPDWWEAIAAFGPWLAAWLVTRAAGGWTSAEGAEFRDNLRRWRLDLRSWLLVAGSPLLFVGGALAVAALVPASSARLAAPGNLSLSSMPALFDLILVGSLAQAVGEEPGWRGFLLARLRRSYAPLRATLLLFPCWLFWHLPMVLSRPQIGVGQFAAFSLGIFSAAIWLTAVWERTHSVPAAIGWHGLVNLLRGLALGISTLAFLGFGMAVAIGALLMMWPLAYRKPVGASSRQHRS